MFSNFCGYLLLCFQPPWLSRSYVLPDRGPAMLLHCSTIALAQNHHSCHCLLRMTVALMATIWMFSSLVYLYAILVFQNPVLLESNKACKVGCMFLSQSSVVEKRNDQRYYTPR